MCEVLLVCLLVIVSFSHICVSHISSSLLNTFALINIINEICSFIMSSNFLLFLVQSWSRVLLFVTPWIAACQTSLSITNFRSLLKLCPLSWWCHPNISSSVIPFSSHLQSFPASGSFLMSHLFASGGQSIGISASTSVLPMNAQDWSPLGWTG